MTEPQGEFIGEFSVKHSMNPLLVHISLLACMAVFGLLFSSGSESNNSPGRTLVLLLLLLAGIAFFVKFLRMKPSHKEIQVFTNGVRIKDCQSPKTILRQRFLPFSEIKAIEKSDHAVHIFTKDLCVFIPSARNHLLNEAFEKYKEQNPEKNES